MKVSIVGAGDVGAQAANEIAGRQIADEVTLVDIIDGLPQGKALDIQQPDQSFGMMLDHMQAQVQHLVIGIEAKCLLAFQLDRVCTVENIFLIFIQEYTAGFDSVGPKNVGADINNCLTFCKDMRI